MKILVDMNLSPKWGEFLHINGIEAVHWSAVGAAATPDPLILAFAADNGFTVLTNDLDFGAMLAASNRNKPSVVQIRSDDLRPASIGEIVCKALRQMQPEIERGALITIDPKRTRLRLLPLRATS